MEKNPLLEKKEGKYETKIVLTILFWPVNRKQNNNNRIKLASDKLKFGPCVKIIPGIT